MAERVDGMRLSGIVLLVLACAATNCAARNSREIFSQAVPVCRALTESQQYDGRETLIRGIYKFTPHGAVFYGKNCSSTLVNIRGASQHRRNRRTETILASLIGLDGFGTAEVVYRAKFRRLPRALCSDVACFNYQIDTIELVAARK
jgi:hypothetical protein